MRKMFAIFFLSVYLLSTTELYQLLKFPVLVEHYFEHKEKSQISVMEFLVLHYKGNHLENHPYDDDYEQDKKLPFMMHTSLLSVDLIVPPLISFGAEGRILTGDSRKSPLRSNHFIDNVYLSSIWQPPKFC